MKQKKTPTKENTRKQIVKNLHNCILFQKKKTKKTKNFSFKKSWKEHLREVGPFKQYGVYPNVPKEACGECTLTIRKPYDKAKLYQHGQVES